MKVLSIYYSATGNTTKAAKIIEETITAAGHKVTSFPINGDANVQFLDYDMIFMGSGVYLWLPGEPLMALIEKACDGYRKSGDMRPNPRRRSNIKAVVYCTYAGTHSGINEAYPAMKWMGQFFEHLGIEVVAEWPIVGEFHNDLKHLSLCGRFGDIRNRPNAADLKELSEKTKSILSIL